MIYLNIRHAMAIFSIISTLQVYASNSINITVRTKENTVAAIGFSVENKERGGLGKQFKGIGPKNKEYLFGYQYSIWGERINCGSLILTKDSTVTLISQGTTCTSVVG